MNKETSISPQYPWNIKFSNTKDNVQTVLVGGIKTWDDNNNAEGVRPESITLHLYANGTEVGTTTATEAGGWAYSFGEQAAVDTNGNAITYTVTEDPVEDYTTSIAAPVTEDGKIVINVTNTYKGKSESSGAAVETGDDSHMMLWAFLTAASLAAFAGSLICRKRKYKGRR